MSDSFLCSNLWKGGLLKKCSQINKLSIGQLAKLQGKYVTDGIIKSDNNSKTLISSEIGKYNYNVFHKSFNIAKNIKFGRFNLHFNNETLVQFDNVEVVTTLGNNSILGLSYNQDIRPKRIKITKNYFYNDKFRTVLFCNDIEQSSVDREVEVIGNHDFVRSYLESKILPSTFRMIVDGIIVTFCLLFLIGFIINTFPK